ncbi:MAG: hypothetical protein NXI27_02255 [Alphaproteobacteria bacterium]|nr:hypothetical protein [Alphaproteobacteria bacterium]
MTAGFWVLSLTIVAGVFVLLYMRASRLRHLGPQAVEDTGSVIVTFSRAYPNNPIREVRKTEDGETAFLRTADGAVGLVHGSGNYNVATLLEPGSIMVESAENDRTIRLHFSRDNIRDGAFTFATIEDAAEVSLWLCGNFLPVDSTETAEPNVT